MQELGSAQKKYPRAYPSWTHSLGVVKKQIRDLERELDAQVTIPEKVRKQFIQIAAVAIRSLLDLEAGSATGAGWTDGFPWSSAWDDAVRNAYNTRMKWPEGTATGRWPNATVSGGASSSTPDSPKPSETSPLRNFRY